MRGLDEDHNNRLKDWFQNKSKIIDSKRFSQNRNWNHVNSTDIHFRQMKNRKGYHEMQSRLDDGSKQILQTRRGLSIFQNQELARELVAPSNAPLFTRHPLNG